MVRAASGGNIVCHKIDLWSMPYMVKFLGSRSLLLAFGAMAYVNQGLSFPPAALKRIEDLENLVQERTAERDAWADRAHELADEARFHQMKSGRTNRTKLGWHEWSDWWECAARSLGYVDDDPPGNGKKGKKGKGKGGKGGHGKGGKGERGKGEQVKSDAMDVTGGLNVAMAMNAGGSLLD